MLCLKGGDLCCRERQWCWGIAAYKTPNLASMLKKLHADVEVILTENACNFVTPITFESLTGKKCLVDTFDRNFQFQVEHVELAKLADVFLIAPARLLS